MTRESQQEWKYDWNLKWKFTDDSKSFRISLKPLNKLKNVILIGAML